MGKDGSPAHAGIDPRPLIAVSGYCTLSGFPRTRGDRPQGDGRVSALAMICRFPRTRGDRPLRQRWIRDDFGVPPHTRG